MQKSPGKPNGKATIPTKIDGMIINELFNLEVAIIEVSGPNWKVDTTHFFEDQKKLAKNLQFMYNAIVKLKDKPCLESKKKLKVYGFHVYLNNFYIYSLCQSQNGVDVFNQEYKFKLFDNKVVIHSLPTLVADLWIIHVCEHHCQPYLQICDYIYGNGPSSQSSYDDFNAEEPYVSPKKKQKAKFAKAL